MFWIYIGILLLISFLWAIFSTKRELSKPREVGKVKRMLHREKILFKK